MPSGDMDPSLISQRQEVEVKKEISKIRGEKCSVSVSLFSVSPTLPQFLFRVLTAWVQAIDVPSSSAATPGSTAPLPSAGPKADWWPSLCLELGSLLQVNPDILRRHLVCELYNQGLDLRAEEV